MYKLTSNSPSRILAAFLVASLTFGPIFPTFVSAEETATTTTDRTSIEERLDNRGGDTTPPTIDTHSNISVQATSESGAIVSYTSPATNDDVDGAGVAVCTPSPGSTFSIGSTVVTCTATDSSGNSATPSMFNVLVAPMPDPPVATSTDPGTASSTPETSPTATTTPPVSTVPPESSTQPPIIDPSTFSTSSTTSAVIDPSQSDTDNTDFENITDGAPPPGPDDTRPIIDVSATSTEALAIVPILMIATSTDGTGSKVGGTIFTGSATASTTVKNILNITRSNVDGAGVTNSSIITADTDNIGEVTTADNTFAFTGENRGQGGVGDATIHTGKAVSSARVLNVVNTNFFNSNGLVLFINPQNGDSLDLRSADLSYLVSGGVGSSPTQLGCTILTCLNSSSLKILNKNEATVNNDVLVQASTGSNAATSTEEGDIDIQTGDAYASAAVLNLINTNFVNSKYLVASFDNFGSMQGNITLPDASFFNSFFKNGNTLPDLNSSSYIVSNDNDETFTGTTVAEATTGNNTAATTSEGDGYGEVVTGKAYTSSTSFTAANQTYVGGSSALFVFHIAGTWTGSIKGLPDGMASRRTAYGIEIYSTGAISSTAGPQGIYNSANFIASSTNKAIVNTDVSVLAETGDNYSITENGIGKIKTGDAYATANVVNMVNTNVVNRNIMFVVFNISGDWSGDIDFGGHSPNLNVTTSVDAANPTAPGSDVTYHFNVANTGDVDADNVILSTAYDKNLLVFSRTNASNSNTVAGTNWNVGRIVAGGSKEIIATARVFAPGLTSGFTMSLPITATVTSNARDQDISDNTQRTTINVVIAPVTDTGGDSGGGSTTDPRDRGSRDDSNSGGGTGTGTGGNTGGGSPSGGSPSGGGGSGGGGGSPPPSGGGGGSSAGAAGNGSGGNTGGSSPSNNVPSNGTAGNTAGSNPSSNQSNNTGGGGGGTAIAGSSGSDSITGIYSSPAIKIKKTSDIASTTAPVTIAYKIVVTNDKWVGPLFKGVLTDTLYNPSGAVMSNRSWDLDTVYEGDEITVTYNAEFDANIKPGLYKNVARVTGTIGNPYSMAASAMTPVEVVKIVQILQNGSVLGTATSTVAIKDTSLKVASSGCALLLISNLQIGGANDSAEVLKLQAFLNTQGAQLPTTGFFGSLTMAAVNAFQRKYASDILSPLGLSRPTGSVYASTRRKINTLACGGVLPAGTVNSAGVYKPVASATASKKSTDKKATSKSVPETKKSADGIKTFLKSLFW